MIKRILLAIFLLSVFHISFAQSIIELKTEGEPLLAGKFLSSLEDSSGQLTLDDVRYREFKPSTTEVLNFDVSTSVFWIKMQVLQTNAEEFVIEVENPLVDQLDFYLLHQGKVVAKEHISKQQDFNLRSEKHQNYRFVLPSNHVGDTLTCYIRCASFAQMNLPVNIGTHEMFINNSGKDFFSAAYFGIMLVMLLYNLFLFLTVKDRTYFYYSLYIASVTLVQLNLKGVGFMYFWPNLPEFERYAVFFFSPLTAFSSIAFIRHFLSTKTYTPKMHRIYWVFIAIYALIIVNALFGLPQISYNLLNVSGLLLALFMIYNAIVIQTRFKYRPALFFLIAWSVFLVSIIIFVMKDIGALPYTPFTASMLQIGSAIEVTLLSFALADKINMLEKEKKDSQALALATAQENERIIQEQNVMLEQKVIERTKALTETNNNLTVALNDLKQAQAQLVESEKMASLGQLTAGIAHEINNPINFVTSNVKPLQRDINELYTLQEQTEQYLSGNEDAMNHVQKLKQDMDYDYIKTEINFLLKGIHEGSSRTAEIVKGLRIFSRVDEDDIKLADINEGLDSTIIIVNNQLNNKIAIEKRYAELPLIDCFPGKLNQVFLNLISNGIYAVKQKFGGEEGGVLSITTELLEKDVVITIHDNGTGMTETTKNKLFEPFFTTKPVGEGTGLGLSIAYNTIKKHNGTLTVETKLGEGTAFIITIPQRQTNG